jgi:hypothetical protein
MAQILADEKYPCAETAIGLVFSVLSVTSVVHILILSANKYGVPYGRAL